MLFYLVGNLLTTVYSHNLNAQCPIPSPGFFVLSWQRKKEAKKLGHLDFSACSVFWLCSWKSWTTMSWTWASHSATLTLSFQVCCTENLPLPTYLDEVSGGQKGFQVF